MSYIDYEYYKTLYGESAVDEATFNLLLWNVERKLDVLTTGADGFKKLKKAFPTNEDDIESVKRCVCELVRIMNELKEAEKRVNSGKGYTAREDGSLQGKVVSSVSAGNESISYSSGGSSSEKTLIDMVLADKEAQERLYADTIVEHLSGVPDANGVNLLFMGTYPKRYL